MNNEISTIAYANSIALGARFEAFETFFWNWLKTIEGDENAIYFRKLFLEFFAQNVHGLFALMPTSLENETVRNFLQMKLEEIEEHRRALDDLTPQ